MNVNELAVELCGILEADYRKRGSMNYTYVVEPGRKYLKIIMADGGHRSVHAFVDASNGNLYKAASWKAPAKGIRYNLYKDMELLKTQADWSGGYLYAR